MSDYKSLVLGTSNAGQHKTFSQIISGRRKLKMNLFTIKDDPVVLQILEEIREQNKLNVDEYTKFKRPRTTIQSFYADKSIFLTGATGFMGKCFVEKVLRDCSDMKHLYLFVRPKTGFKIQDRMEKYFSNAIFDRVRKINPNFQDKVVLVSGDLYEENLGLSDEDRQMLIDNVDIIVHNGATVKFNEAVNVSLRINVLGTKNILDLALACKHIQVFTYVSTAFSQCYMRHIKEEFYAPPADLKVIHDMIAADQASEKGLSEEKTKQFLDKWPNIYTFTKAMSEGLVRQYGEKANFACCVYRPTVVIGAYKEPLIGWIGNGNGPTTSFAASALGAIHAMCYDAEVFDTVPVDYSINALISCIYDASKAWEIERRPKVYNYGSSMANPVNLQKFRSSGKKVIPTISSKYLVWHFSMIFTPYKWLFYILHFLLHFIPALLGDIVLLVMMKKPRLLNIFYLATKNMHWIIYFANFGLRVQATEMRKVFDSITEEDRKIFDFNIWNLNWHDYICRYVIGSRIYLLKEPIDNIQKVKWRCVMFRNLHYTVLTVFYLIVGYYFIKLFSFIESLIFH